MPAIEKGKTANSGYYQVGAQVFNNKVAALYAATKAKQFPEFHLHDETFSLVPWTIPPTKSLEEVYKKLNNGKPETILPYLLKLNPANALEADIAREYVSNLDKDLIAKHKELNVIKDILKIFIKTLNIIL